MDMATGSTRSAKATAEGVMNGSAYTQKSMLFLMASYVRGASKAMQASALELCAHMILMG